MISKTVLDQALLSGAIGAQSFSYSAKATIRRSRAGCIAPGSPAHNGRLRLRTTFHNGNLLPETPCVTRFVQGCGNKKGRVKPVANRAA